MAEQVFSVSYVIRLDKQIADLTAERDSLTVQLDSCQGALRETIVENSANCDRAEKAEGRCRQIQQIAHVAREQQLIADSQLAEARQHIAHLEDQLADAETARTLALGIAERAEQERDEARQALIDRTDVPTIREG